MSELRSSAAHVFVDDVDSPELAPDDRHHLERVLRLRVGEDVTVSDGAGRWRTCTFGAVLEPLGDVRAEARPQPPVTIALAFTKGQRFDWAVQKLTELGVDTIVPLAAARSVVRWEKDRAGHHVGRVRRIARQAAMQSRRVWLPAITDPRTVADVAATPGAAMAVPGGGPPSLGNPVVLVGPEGGWAEDEEALALPTVGLGATVLRSETAAVAAATLLCGLRAGVVAPRR